MGEPFILEKSQLWHFQVVVVVRWVVEFSLLRVEVDFRLACSKGLFLTATACLLVANFQVMPLASPTLRTCKERE